MKRSPDRLQILHLVLAVPWWGMALLAAYLAVHPLFAGEMPVHLGTAVVVGAVGVAVLRLRGGWLMLSVVAGSIAVIGMMVSFGYGPFGSPRFLELEASIGWLPLAAVASLTSGLIGFVVGAVEIARRSHVKLPGPPDETPPVMPRDRRAWLLTALAAAILLAFPLLLLQTLPPDASASPRIAAVVEAVRQNVIAGEIAWRFPHYRYLDARCSNETVYLLFERRLYPYLAGVGVGEEIVVEEDGTWRASDSFSALLSGSFSVAFWERNPAGFFADWPLGPCDQALNS